MVIDCHIACSQALSMPSCVLLALHAAWHSPIRANANGMTRTAFAAHGCVTKFSTVEAYFHGVSTRLRLY